jgi:hypothetical protein
MHLTYTQSYWGRFCPDVLGKPLHHNPTKGGSAEGEKFRDWYEKTLASYRRLFGHAPPGDIWPDPRRRFGTHSQFRRLDVQRFWVIPKPRLPKVALSRLALLLGIAGALAIVTAGCVPVVAEWDEFGTFGTSIVIAIGAAILLMTRDAFGGPRQSRKRDDGNGAVRGGGGCGGSTNGDGTAGDGGDGAGGCGASGCAAGGCGGGGCGGGCGG